MQQLLFNITETIRLWVPSTNNNKPAVSCDRSNPRYDFCFVNVPTVMFPTTSALVVVDPTTRIHHTTTEKIRPYPRKWEDPIMARIKEITIRTTSSIPDSEVSCQVRHNTPALVFSTGGYTGNLFHDFNDGMIPLFITSHLIASDHRRPVLVIANCHNWWISKYADLLRGLTSHPIINLDNETDVHCFPSATVGLVSHGFASINSSLMRNSESLHAFRAFLDHSYMAAIGPQLPPTAMTDLVRPRLVLVAREGVVGRVILNQDDVVRTAEEIGFEVTVFKPTPFTNLQEAYRLINASHAMLGVHGAALTHLYFLRPGAVLIQVVPIGLEWVSGVCFGEPAEQMGVDYMEYKIRVDESSLSEKYGEDEVVLRNPRVVVKKGWYYTKNIYLKRQDVRLDLKRVRSVLEVAHQKATRLVKTGF